MSIISRKHSVQSQESLKENSSRTKDNKNNTNKISSFIANYTDPANLAEGLLEEVASEIINDKKDKKEQKELNNNETHIQEEHSSIDTSDLENANKRENPRSCNFHNSLALPEGFGEESNAKTIELDIAKPKLKNADTAIMNLLAIITEKDFDITSSRDKLVSFLNNQGAYLGMSDFPHKLISSCERGNISLEKQVLPAVDELIEICKQSKITTTTPINRFIQIKTTLALLHSTINFKLKLAEIPQTSINLSQASINDVNVTDLAKERNLSLGPVLINLLKEVATEFKNKEIIRRRDIDLEQVLNNNKEAWQNIDFADITYFSFLKNLLHTKVLTNEAQELPYVKFQLYYFLEFLAKNNQLEPILTKENTQKIEEFLNIDHIISSPHLEKFHKLLDNYGLDNAYASKNKKGKLKLQTASATQSLLNVFKKQTTKVYYVELDHKHKDLPEDAKTKLVAGSISSFIKERNYQEKLANRMQDFYNNKISNSQLIQEIEDIKEEIIQKATQVNHLYNHPSNTLSKLSITNKNLELETDSSSVLNSSKVQIGSKNKTQDIELSTLSKNPIKLEPKPDSDPQTLDELPEYLKKHVEATMPRLLQSIKIYDSKNKAEYDLLNFLILKDNNKDSTDTQNLKSEFLTKHFDFIKSNDLTDSQIKKLVCANSLAEAYSETEEFLKANLITLKDLPSKIRIICSAILENKNLTNTQKDTLLNVINYNILNDNYNGLITKIILNSAIENYETKIEEAMHSAKEQGMKYGVSTLVKKAFGRVPLQPLLEASIEIINKEDKNKNHLSLCKKVTGEYQKQIAMLKQAPQSISSINSIKDLLDSFSNSQGNTEKLAHDLVNNLSKLSASLNNPSSKQEKVELMNLLKSLTWISSHEAISKNKQTKINTSILSRIMQIIELKNIPNLKEDFLDFVYKLGEDIAVKTKGQKFEEVVSTILDNVGSNDLNSITFAIMLVLGHLNKYTDQTKRYQDTIHLKKLIEQVTEESSLSLMIMNSSSEAYKQAQKQKIAAAIFTTVTTIVSPAGPVSAIAQGVQEVAEDVAPNRNNYNYNLYKSFTQSAIDHIRDVPAILKQGLNLARERAPKKLDRFIANHFEQIKSATFEYLVNSLANHKSLVSYLNSLTQKESESLIRLFLLNIEDSKEILLFINNNFLNKSTNRNKTSELIINEIQQATNRSNHVDKATLEKTIETYIAKIEFCLHTNMILKDKAQQLLEQLKINITESTRINQRSINRTTHIINKLLGNSIGQSSNNENTEQNGSGIIGNIRNFLKLSLPHIHNQFKKLWQTKTANDLFYRIDKVLELMKSNSNYIY